VTKEVQTIALTVVKDSATEINQLHLENCRSAEQTIERAIRIGQLLAEERAECKHGEWLRWLKAKIQFPQRTAYRYQRIYEARTKLASVANLADAYRIALPQGKRKTTKKAKEAKPLSAEEATATWLTFFESLPENQRPAVARAAFGWTKHNHELLGDIDIKYGQTRTLKMTL
jgi:Protein of unknown function (DUF3102)